MRGTRTEARRNGGQDQRCSGRRKLIAGCGKAFPRDSNAGTISMSRGKHTKSFVELYLTEEGCRILYLLSYLATSFALNSVPFRNSSSGESAEATASCLKSQCVDPSNSDTDSEMSPNDIFLAVIGLSSLSHSQGLPLTISRRRRSRKVLSRSGCTAPNQPTTQTHLPLSLQNIPVLHLIRPHQPVIRRVRPGLNLHSTKVLPRPDQVPLLGPRPLHPRRQHLRPVPRRRLPHLPQRRHQHRHPEQKSLLLHAPTLGRHLLRQHPHRAPQSPHLPRILCRRGASRHLHPQRPRHDRRQSSHYSGRLLGNHVLPLQHLRSDRWVV